MTKQKDTNLRATINFFFQKKIIFIILQADVKMPNFNDFDYGSIS